ncbi:MAG TPA: hypothetical protein V6D11_26305 [Waterburya sp.]
MNVLSLHSLVWSARSLSTEVDSAKLSQLLRELLIEDAIAPNSTR